MPISKMLSAVYIGINSPFISVSLIKNLNLLFQLSPKNLLKSSGNQMGGIIKNNWFLLSLLRLLGVVHLSYLVGNLFDS